MSGPTHELEARLSEYLDGDLSPSVAREVEAHIEGCGACRDVLAGLAAVRERAGSLEDRAPGRDLWPGIRAVVERPTVIDLDARRDRARRAGRTARRDTRSRYRRGVFLSLPQLAGAAAALTVLAAGGAWALARASGVPAPAPAARVPATGEVQPASTGGSRFAEQADEVARLQEALEKGRDRLDPNTIRILEKNLALIDQAIRESVEALAVDPENPFVEEHLRRSWERKVTYLREATALLETTD